MFFRISDMISGLTKILIIMNGLPVPLVTVAGVIVAIIVLGI